MDIALRDATTAAMTDPVEQGHGSVLPFFLNDVYRSAE
jgi:hypothetical protein